MVVIIDFFNQSPCREIGEADAHCVSFGFFRELQNRQRDRDLPGHKQSPGKSDHVRVHSGTADVFSHLSTMTKSSWRIGIFGMIERDAFAHAVSYSLNLSGATTATSRVSS